MGIYCELFLVLWIILILNANTKNISLAFNYAIDNL